MSVPSAAPYIKWRQNSVKHRQLKIFQPVQEKKNLQSNFQENQLLQEKKMKLFFILAVATSTIMLLVQGAPHGHITSEEMGKAVEQLKEMITSEIQAAEANLVCLLSASSSSVCFLSTRAELWQTCKHSNYVNANTPIPL
jgi:hypothetical protein